MSNFLQDIRYGLRMIYKNSQVTIAAVLTMALAIGSNTMIFSVINAFMLRPLPFEEPKHLVAIHEALLKQGKDDGYISFPDFKDVVDQNSVLAEASAYDEKGFNMSANDRPERVYGAVVSPNLFSTLGVRPSVGRDFLPEEGRPGADGSVILSDALWKRRFNSDRNVIGRTLTLNGRICSIVGVMPPRFKFPETSELWMPLAVDENSANRGDRSFSAVGRLRSGVTIEQAQERLNDLARRLQEQYPESNGGWGLRLIPLHKKFVGEVDALLYIFLGVVLFMLLIACANVSNLFLAKALTREKEIAIRAALGGGRSRIIRQLLTETVMVALLGGALGVLMAWWGLALVISALPGEIPFWIRFDIDISVLAFTFGVSLLAGMVFGLAPALRVSRPNLQALLAEGSKAVTGSIHRDRLRSMLVVFEIAIALTLLIGTTLMIRSFLQLQRSDPGFEIRNTLTMKLRPDGPNYTERAQRINFFQRVVERTKTLPGAQAVAVANRLPINQYQSSQTIVMAEGQTAPAGEALPATVYLISADYFKVLGVPILNGRLFSDLETSQTPPVAIVNQTAALRLWPETNAVGKRLTLARSARNEGRNEDWINVVGVVKDFKQDLRDRGPQPQVYLPYTQADSSQMTLMARAFNNPAALTAAIRDQIAAVDKGQPVWEVATMERRLELSVWQSRIYGLVFSVFAAIALILVTLGVYSVMSYSVTQRTQEIAIRMALGAQRRQVLGPILSQGLRLAVIGIVIGLLAAFAITNFLSGFLYGITPTDPKTFALATLSLLVVALVANLIPAVKAIRIDPIVALREN